MLNDSQKLNPKLFKEAVEEVPVRNGFGEGLAKAGEEDPRIVGLCADLVESTKMLDFAKRFPHRFIEIGIAEQNLAAVAAGMAAMGKIPFITSYAMFSPGRNWEQIRTTICYNNQNVKIVGSHAGVSVGPDGGTHQAIEDIALMRVMPHMIVVCPGDAVEAEKATLAIARHPSASYLRVAREKTPIFSTENTPFELGKAYVLRSGNDITLAGTGTMTYQLLMLARMLEEKGVSAEVLHVPTIKPLDKKVILESAAKTGRIVTAEEAQVAGGFGGAVAELLSEKQPTPLLRIGMLDRYGESGAPNELLDHFNLTAEKMLPGVEKFIAKVPQYKPGY
jgi:transketolase